MRSSNAMVLAVEILFPFIELLKGLENEILPLGSPVGPGELAQFVATG